MAKSVVEVMKSGVNAALEETVKEIWGEEAVDEIQPDQEEDDLRKEITRMIVLLKKSLGSQLAGQLCGVTSARDFSKWTTGEELPNSWQLRYLRQVYEITVLLGMRLKVKETKFWWLNRNEYIAGYTPFNLFASDPNGVRMAALNFLMNVS